MLSVSLLKGATAAKKQKWQSEEDGLLQPF
jgi:hypothetical protein